jgi:protein SCO1
MIRVGNYSLSTLLLCTCFTACVTASSWTAYGQILKELPAAARGIDVEDKVGDFLPLDLVFTDERGNRIGLGKFFKQGKPVILTLNYSDCPGLCIAQLDNLVSNLREPVGEGLGKRFEIVTVSIDPTETTSKALKTKAKYTGLLRGMDADKYWHFLTGEQSQISKLAESVGFKYTYDKASKRYSHAAVTYFISSDGRICRYLLSLGVEPDQLNLALADASEGRLTTSLSDAFIQLCYMYDPDANRYSTDARRLMAFGGAAFTMMIFGLTAPFWFSRRGAAKAPNVQTEAAKKP